MIKTKQTNWSDTIRKRRLSWYGHVSRLDEQTPALKHIRSNYRMQKLRGGQRKTWIKNLEKDLDDLRLYPQEILTELTQNRSVWRKSCTQTLRWFLHRQGRRHRRRRVHFNQTSSFPNISVFMLVQNSSFYWNLRLQSQETKHMSWHVFIRVCFY